MGIAVRVGEVVTLVIVAGVSALFATGIHYGTYRACAGGFVGYALNLTFVVDPLIVIVGLVAAFLVGRTYGRRTEQTRVTVFAIRLATVAGVAVLAWLALTVANYPYRDDEGPGPCPAWLVK